ncbi:MAG: metallophosphoesterase family protein [Anaerolineae bacterium]|nr:metallophosphoesterase family protein [Anaerolineae bacterium]
MTIYAILSDVHGRTSALQSVLDDARQHGATAFIALGDIGTDPCYNLLREVDAQSTFGNYEVSGWDKLAPENQQWVLSLPAVLIGDTFLAAHAAPYFPTGVADVHQVLDYLLERQVKWQALFPNLAEDEHARWLTFAELEARDKRVFFHGHTHLQRAWRVGPDNAMTSIQDDVIDLETSSRYIIGVGSIILPVEERWSRYALYDSTAGQVELHKVS